MKTLMLQAIEKARHEYIQQTGHIPELLTIHTSRKEELEQECGCTIDKNSRIFGMRINLMNQIPADICLISDGVKIGSL